MTNWSASYREALAVKCENCEQVVGKFEDWKEGVVFCTQPNCVLYPIRVHLIHHLLV